MWNRGREKKEGGNAERYETNRVHTCTRVTVCANVNAIVWSPAHGMIYLSGVMEQFLSFFFLFSLFPISHFPPLSICSKIFCRLARWQVICHSEQELRERAPLMDRARRTHALVRACHVAMMDGAIVANLLIGNIISLHIAKARCHGAHGESAERTRWDFFSRRDFHEQNIYFPSGCASFELTRNWHTAQPVHPRRSYFCFLAMPDIKFWRINFGKKIVFQARWQRGYIR